MEKVREAGAPFYRPALPEQESEGIQPGVITLMKQCWTEDPAERPSFDDDDDGDVAARSRIQLRDLRLTTSSKVSRSSTKESRHFSSFFASFIVLTVV